jgi:hypothetical protein
MSKQTTKKSEIPPPPPASGVKEFLTRRPLLLFLSYVALPLALILLLLQPPVSLLERLNSPGAGFREVPAQGGVIETSAGTQLTFAPGDNARWVSLTPAPADSPARKALPAGVEPVGEVSQLQTTGNAAQPVQISLPLPAEAVPAQLDVYTWDGAKWQWQPSRLNAGGSALESELSALPQAIGLMEITAAAPVLAANVAHKLVDEVTPAGLMVAANGSLTGTIETADNAETVLPVIRNWAIDGRLTPLHALLTTASTRQAHLAALVELVKQGGYQGLTLDYRQLDPTLEPDLTAFLTDLRAALPAAARLAVTVSLPQRSGGGWDTGAYNWAALNQLGAEIRLPLPPGQGDSESLADLLAWAVRQVNRQQLQLLVSAAPIEQVEGVIEEISPQRRWPAWGRLPPSTCRTPSCPARKSISPWPPRRLYRPATG